MSGEEGAITPGRLLFSLWILFLLTLLAFGGRPPIFFDVLAQRDVSSLYSLSYPLTRLLLDPLATLAFTIASKDLEWLLPFTLLYFAFPRSRRFAAPPWMKRFALCYAVMLALFTLVAVSMLLLETRLKVETRFIGLLLEGHIGCLVLYAMLSVRTRRISLEERRGGPIANYFSLLALLLAANIALISAPWPTRKIETTLAPGEELLDLHSHTTSSDGFMSPAGRAHWYERQGITLAAISDHHTTLGAQRAQSYAKWAGLGVQILTSEEYTSRDPLIHLNVYGSAAAEDLVPEALGEGAAGYRVLGAKELLESARARGGHAVLNHYIDGGPPTRPYSLQDLATWGIGGVEIVNGWLDMKAFGTTEELRAFCLAQRLPCVSGSDEHQNRELRHFMRVSGLTRPVETDALFAALARNDHQVVEIGYPGVVTVPYALRLVDGFVGFVNHLLVMTRFQTLSWLVWSLLGSVFVVRRLARRL